MRLRIKINAMQTIACYYICGVSYCNLAESRVTERIVVHRVNLLYLRS
jgi:hypothetical protein